MKYLISSTVATLCVFGATGAYYANETETGEEAESIIQVEKAISNKMAEATEGVFLPYLACEIEPDEELTDEKIENHIAECMQKRHSWQPVQSYPN